MEQVKRPGYEQISEELFKRVGEIVYAWSDGNHDLEECISDAADILEYYYNADGFELAKDFERKGYSADSELVDELNDVQFIYYDLLKEATRSWAAQQQISLDLEPGVVITFKDHRLKEMTGEIVKLYPETAQYGIWYDGLKGQKGVTCVIINKEDVFIKS